MKIIFSLFTGIVAFVVLGLVSPLAFACPWYDPFCTPTPTPTPTPVIFMKIPSKEFIPLLINTSTPTVTPTVTPTNSPTPTVTNTPTVTVTTTPGITPMISETPADASSATSPVPTVTPAEPRTLIAGFTIKELLFVGLIVFLLLVVLLQSNWTKIRTWLHDKTQ